MYHKVACVLVLFCSYVVADDFIIESPKVTNWGTWGPVEKCPEGELVYGYRMRVQPGSGMTTDDTALNTVELLCISNAKRANATQLKLFTSIKSAEGHAGDYGAILECPEPGFANGFQLRSEGNQYLLDDSAANGVKLFCSTGETLEGYDNPSFGDWTEPQRCPRSTYICGIQTQVEGPGQTDDTALNNVNMVCC